MKFIGTRFQITKPDRNEVARGEVVVPIGHWATVGDYFPESGYVVLFDDDEGGIDMGWCFYSAAEIIEQLGQQIVKVEPV